MSYYSGDFCRVVLGIEALQRERGAAIGWDDVSEAARGEAGRRGVLWEGLRMFGSEPFAYARKGLERLCRDGSWLWDVCAQSGRECVRLEGERVIGPWMVARRTLAPREKRFCVLAWDAWKWSPRGIESPLLREMRTGVRDVR